MDEQIISDDLKSHFLNLYSMALSDCQIDTVELEFLFKFGEEKGIPKTDLENIILNPNNVKFTIPNDIIQKVEYLYDFARMVLADGEIDPFEKNTLKKFCLKFGFNETNVDDIADFLLNQAQKGTPKAEIFEMVRKNLN